MILGNIISGILGILGIICVGSSIVIYTSFYRGADILAYGTEAYNEKMKTSKYTVTELHEMMCKSNVKNLGKNQKYDLGYTFMIKGDEYIYSFGRSSKLYGTHTLSGYYVNIYTGKFRKVITRKMYRPKTINTSGRLPMASCKGTSPYDMSLDWKSIKPSSEIK